MLTGVIYGAIVVAWATYLVPLALRRDEQAARSRSIDRFSSAMRVLVSRGSRVEASPSRATEAPGAPEPEAEATRMLVSPVPNRAAERAAAARRRVVLYVLVGLVLLCGLVAIVGLLPWWSFVAPLVLLGGFLVVARLSVRKANAPYWVELPQAAASSASTTPAATAARVAADDSGRDDAEPTITLTAAQRRAAATGVMPTASPRVASGSTLWDPLPVTLPTYVDAPVARRAFRTIPLGSGDARPSVAAATAATAPQPVQEIHEDIPQAVNG